MLPLLRAPLFSSFVLLFIVGVREFTLPLILHSPDNVVLSVLLWKVFQNGDAPQGRGEPAARQGRAVSGRAARRACECQRTES